MFDKVLVANRGEIAVRVIRTLTEMNIKSVAVYSDADRDAHHVRMADEAYRIGPAPSAESYLRIDAILAAARESGARAIHPGYGFLSENHRFAAACQDAGLVFLGPSARVLALLGDKLEARRTAERAGAPTIPGAGPLPGDVSGAVKMAESVGFPLMIKAAGGGGGKGMRIVRSSKECRDALALTRGEAQAAFGDPTLYVERYIDRPRHIEMQVLGDAQGNIVWLGERECSIQRRHQKLIEETPSPALDADSRERMGSSAVAIMKEAGYVGAGTVEFLLAPDGSFYFLEVNARLQVEHPVTECVTGIDLVRQQVKIAAGEPLGFTQDEVHRSGSAIESRITAEDPARGFLPAIGTVKDLRLPEGPFIRSDFGILPGSQVSVHYDPLIGKLIAWGRTREDARRRLLRAVSELRISGVLTNTHFHVWALQHPAFIAGELHTGFIDQHFTPDVLTTDAHNLRSALVAAAIQAYEDRRKVREPKESTSISAWKQGGRRWR